MLFCLKIQAQKVGIVAGVNFDKPIENNPGFSSPNYQYGLGYQIGLKTVFTVNEKIEFSPQIHFVNVRTAIKGAKLTDNDSWSVRVPLLVHYKPVTQFNLQAGPSVDIHLTKGIGVLRQAVVRGIIGAGYRFNESIELNLQYGHSLYNEVKKQYTAEIKTSTFMLTLAWYFKK